MLSSYFLPPHYELGENLYGFVILALTFTISFLSIPLVLFAFNLLEYCLLPLKTGPLQVHKRAFYRTLASIHSAKPRKNASEIIFFF